MGHRRAKQIQVRKPSARRLRISDSEKVSGHRFLYELRLTRIVDELDQLREKGHSSEYVQKVTSYLESNDPGIIAETLISLQTERTNRFSNAVVPFLEYNNQRVQMMAYEALRIIDSHQLVKEARRIIRKKRVNAQTVKFATKMLAKEPRPADRLVVWSLLRNPNWEVRDAALDWVYNDRNPKSAEKVWPLVRDPWRSVRVRAIATLRVLGAKGAFTLFGLQEDLPKLAAFLDPSNRIRRARLARTGSAGFAFGGKLFGKVIARAISTENLKAWVAAEKAGIPVEPLIWKNGKLRAHRIRRNRLDRFVSEGDILVYSRVIEGPTLIDFLGGPSGRKWRNEVLRQMGSIEKSFIRRRIIHGHLHYRNMIVTWAEKDGKKWPKVVVIDFDQARVEE